MRLPQADLRLYFRICKKPVFLTTRLKSICYILSFSYTFYFSSIENLPEDTKVGHGQKVAVTDIPPKTDTDTDDERVEIEREARVKKEKEAKVGKRRQKIKKRAAKDGVKAEKENGARVRIESRAEVAVRAERGRKVKRRGEGEVGVKTRNERGEKEVLTERGGIVAGVKVGIENESIAVGVEVATGYAVEVGVVRGYEVGARSTGRR